MVAWVITQLFSHIWEISSRTLLHCYCLDEDLSSNHRGSNSELDTEQLKGIMAGFDQIAAKTGADGQQQSSFMSSPGKSMQPANYL